jgi:hypothetical protein
MTVFSLLMSSNFEVLGGATSEPSSSPMTLAPCKEGMIYAFPMIKFSRVNFSVGGLPRATIVPAIDDGEDGIRRLNSDVIRRPASVLGCYDPCIGELFLG